MSIDTDLLWDAWSESPQREKLVDQAAEEILCNDPTLFAEAMAERISCMDIVNLRKVFTEPDEFVRMVKFDLMDYVNDKAEARVNSDWENLQLAMKEQAELRRFEDES